MKCQEKNCSGIIDEKNEVRIPIDAFAFLVLYPCTICGRLHRKNGSKADNDSGNLLFFKNKHLVIVEDGLEKYA